MPYAIDAAVLLVLSLVFCLHYYHDRFIIQGDVFLNLYVHGYPGLFWGGWDPYAWGYLGWYPIFGALFPLNLAMHALVNVFGGEPRAVIHLLEANAALSLFLHSFFFYLLFRFLGIGRGGAVLGASVISFAGFHAHASVREFDLFYLHSFMFVPLAMIALLKALRTGSLAWSGAAGLAVGLSLLGGGNVPMFLYAPGFVFLPLVDRPVREALAPRELGRLAMHLAVAMAVAACVGAAMLLPSLAYMKYSLRGLTLAEGIVSRGVAPTPWYTLFTLLYKNWWPVGSEGVNLAYHEIDSFLGLPVLVLAAAGVAHAVRTGARGAGFMFFMAAFALLSMHIAYLPFIFQAPFRFVFEAMSIRFPYRFFMVLLLPAAFFAAWGYEAVLARRRDGGRPVGAALAALAIALYGAGALYFWSKGFNNALAPSFRSVMAVTVAFCALLAVIGFVLKPETAWRNRACLAMVPLVFAFFYFSMEDTVAQGSYGPLKNWAAELESAPKLTLAESLRVIYDKPMALWRPIIESETPPYRILSQNWTNMRESLWAPMMGVDVAFEPADDPATSRYLVNYYDATGRYESPLLDLYNIKYVLIRGYSETKFKPTKVKDIYSNPDAFDRFFVVRGAMRYSSDEALFAALAGASRETLANYVLLPSVEDAGRADAPPRNPGGYGIDIISRTSSEVVLDVRMEGRGWLVASEPWFPAWRAEVDGRPAELLRAYGAFQGVRLEGGPRHRVMLRFEDRYTFWGRVISILALAASAALAVRSLIRNRE